MSSDILALIVLAFAALPALMTFVNLSFFRLLPEAAGDSPACVSLLIPARNEDSNIGDAIEAALASKRVELELIVMNDGSTDDTALVVERIARRDRRVRLLDAPPLPPGWIGKQHACQLLGNAARFPTLVFVDADVRLAPDALVRIAGFLRARQLGLLSGFPRQVTGTFLESLIVPLIHVLLLGYLPMWLMRVFRAPSLATGCGQLMAARKDAYEAVGGHAAIRSSRHDGLTLPRVFRRAGFDTDIFDATDAANCRMYSDPAEVWQGFSKNADEAMATPVALPIWTLLLGFGHVAPFLLLLVGIATGGTAAIAAGALSVTAILAMRITIAVRFRQSALSVTLHPVGIAVLLAMQCSALFSRLRTRPVTWRGRSYVPTEAGLELAPLSGLAQKSRVRSCRLGPGDGLIFDAPADRLFAAWLAVADRQPRTQRLGCDPSERRSLHVQRTCCLRFVDEIRAEVTDLGEGRSALTVDSRSRFAPVWDLGVNRRRAIAWCAVLKRDQAAVVGHEQRQRHGARERA